MDCGPEYGGPEVTAWGAIEDRYLGQVHRELSDVPRRQRRDLITTVRADLAERPEAASWDELVSELGAPAEYAAVVRAEHGLARRVGVLGHLQATRWATRAVVVTAAIAVAGFGLWNHAVTTAHAGITNSCAAVDADDPGVKVRELEAADVSERRISYVDGATVGLELCLSADRDVKIVDVAVHAAPVSLWEPTGVRAADMGAAPEQAAPVLDHAPLGPLSGGLRVIVEGRLTDCEDYEPGGGNSFDTALVTYRYRGRTRTAPVDLVSTYTFVSPPDARCPRPRPNG